MSAGQPYTVEQKENTSVGKRRAYLQRRDPRVIVDAARKHTLRALEVLVKLMGGDSGQTDELGRALPVPPQTMMRAAEIIIERGYGKAPQAILIGGDGNLGGMQGVPIMERIAMIMQAQVNGGEVRDLEASEIMEMPSAALTVSPPKARAAAPAAEDLI